VSDSDAFGYDGADGFIDSRFDARTHPAPDNLEMIELVCETLVRRKRLGLLDSRLFHFLETFPGDYRISVRPAGFNPYIFILDSGYVPPPGYVVGGELTITLIGDVPAGITGFVGAISVEPHVIPRFDIELFCPEHPDTVQVSGIVFGFETVMQRINARMGTGFSGLLTYVPGTTYYEQADGFGNYLRLFYFRPTDQWQFQAKRSDDFAIHTASGGGSMYPVNPYGDYSLNDGFFLNELENWAVQIVP